MSGEDLLGALGRAVEAARADRQVTAPEPREDVAQRPRCPGCAHTCCPYPNLECGGESDVVAACEREDVAVAEVRDNWRFFKAHVPVGEYLPVGQLDGDCRECHTSWPCAPYLEALAPLIAEREAKAWDAGWARRADYSERRDVPIDWPDLNPYRADRRAER